MLHVHIDPGDDEAPAPVVTVTLDRPERRNAVDHHTLEALADALAAAEADGCRALVLRGAGGHFCAGADLTGVEDEGFVALLGAVLRALHEVPFPTIAAVEGACLGAGTQLASACDLRHATPDSTWGVPASKLGLQVDFATLELVATLVGHGTAKALFFGADQLDGTRAHQLGLVQRLGPADEAAAWARQLATLAPLTIAGHKMGLNLVAAAAPDGAQRYRATFERAWASADLQEGLAAFRERRPPRFVGR